MNRHPSGTGMNRPGWRERPKAILRAMKTSARRFAKRLFPFSIAIAAALLVSACSQQGATPNQPSASAQAAANKAAVTEELGLYRQMLARHNDSLAAQLGQEIVDKYPDSPAAAEVRKTLPKVAAAAKAQAEKTRLQRLWLYQKADQDGLQHTASIYAGGDRQPRIRLVLRRHEKWGLSTYLFSAGKGFVCKGTCRVAMRFDGKKESWKAYLPETGEPAMFIQDDKRFIDALEKAKVIEMDVVTRDDGKRTLKFEVAGFDPAKFPPLPKH